MTKLTLLVVKSSDPNRLKNLYEIFGLSFQQEQHGKGPIHFSCQLGDTILEIYPCDDRLLADTNRLGFQVDNLDQLIHRLTTLPQQGLEVASQPKQTPWGYRALVRDFETRIIELYQKPT